MTSIALHHALKLPKLMNSLLRNNLQHFSFLCFFVLSLWVPATHSHNSKTSSTKLPDSSSTADPAINYKDYDYKTHFIPSLKWSQPLAIPAVDNSYESLAAGQLDITLLKPNNTVPFLLVDAYLAQSHMNLKPILQNKIAAAIANKSDKDLKKSMANLWIHIPSNLSKDKTLEAVEQSSALIISYLYNAPKTQENRVTLSRHIPESNKNNFSQWEHISFSSSTIRLNYSKLDQARSTPNQELYSFAPEVTIGSWLKSSLMAWVNRSTKNSKDHSQRQAATRGLLTAGTITYSMVTAGFPISGIAGAVLYQGSYSWFLQSIPKPYNKFITLFDGKVPFWHDIAFMITQVGSIVPAVAIMHLNGFQSIPIEPESILNLTQAIDMFGHLSNYSFGLIQDSGDSLVSLATDWGSAPTYNSPNYLDLAANTVNPIQHLTLQVLENISSLESSINASARDFVNLPITQIANYLSQVEETRALELVATLKQFSSEYQFAILTTCAVAASCAFQNTTQGFIDSSVSFYEQTKLEQLNQKQIDQFDEALQNDPNYKQVAGDLWDNPDFVRFVGRTTRLAASIGGNALTTLYLFGSPQNGLSQLAIRLMYATAFVGTTYRLYIYDKYAENHNKIYLVAKAIATLSYERVTGSTRPFADVANCKRSLLPPSL